MNIFNYLNEDAEHVSNMLHETVDHFLTWDMDRVFEQSKKALASLDEHLKKEKIVSNNLIDNSELADSVSKSVEQTKAIKSDMNSLIMIHVDEPGYAKVLQSMMEKLDEYRAYNQETFYPAIERTLSEDQFASIKTQMEQVALS